MLLGVRNKRPRFCATVKYITARLQPAVYSDSMLTLPNHELSVWRQAYDHRAYPELRDDIETDVVVIGAGITGLTTAYLLKQTGLRVVVLEKDTVGGGTTGRTTGKVTAQHGIMYHDLARRVGDEYARLYGEANQTAIERMDAIVAEENIDCDWRRDDNYVFTDDPKKISQFQAEAETAARLGLPARFALTTPLPFATEAAVTFSEQGAVHAQKYLLGLARAVNGNGSHVFERSGAIGIWDGRRTCRVATNQANVTAKQIVVATNVPTLPLLARGGYCALEYPTESFSIAARCPAEFDGMYISPDKRHQSILPFESGGERFVLVVGAGGNLPGFRLGKKTHWRQLADYAERLLGATEVTHCWADRDYLAYDGVPLIGKLYPWSKNLYVGTAYKKWGLTGGTVAGMILCDTITGRDNPWASVFNSQRRGTTAAIWRTAVHRLRRD